MFSEKRLCKIVDTKKVLPEINFGTTAIANLQSLYSPPWRMAMPKKKKKAAKKKATRKGKKKGAAEGGRRIEVVGKRQPRLPFFLL